MNQSTTVQFSNRVIASDEVLILEQEDWRKGIGYVTKLDLIDYIEERFYGGTKRGVDCDVEDGTFVTAVFVYPYDVDLVYNIGATWGTFETETIHDIEVQEILKFNLDSSQNTKYPVQDLLSYEWYDNIWDDQGMKITPPAFTISDKREVVVGSDIYGAVKVKYVTHRHTRALSISARADVVENVFSSVVYTTWDGGIKMLRIDPPPGAEEDYTNGVTCKSRTSASFDGAPPFYDPPAVEGETEEILIDYCTQGPL